MSDVYRCESAVKRNHKSTNLESIISHCNQLTYTFFGITLLASNSLNSTSVVLDKTQGFIGDSFDNNGFIFANLTSNFHVTVGIKCLTLY